MVTFDSDVLSGDKPLTNPNDDRLGYAPFAKHLAGSIAEMAPSEGLVIGLYGSWGSGKSTVLNFVVHYLERLPEDDRPVVVRFNPWWFAGQEELTRRFFGQLRARLDRLGVLTDTARRLISEFGDLIADVPAGPVPIPLIGKLLSRVIGPKAKDIVELKDSIAEMLRKQGRKIVVFVDDIDRLPSDEIRQLFSLVKVVADFPNVVYVLALDKDVATEALEPVQGSGAPYLEKIVQVPFELPLPDRTSLRRLLFERLDVILKGTPEDMWDETYWGNVYLEGIDPFIETPRSIVRLVNILSVTYPPVVGEVNPVDFIAIEALRVFNGPVYDAVRKNPDTFAGYADGAIAGTSADRQKRFVNELLDQTEEARKDAVKQLLIRLFPRVEAIWENVIYGANSLTHWSRGRRVCHPDMFPIYFRLAVPEGSISNAEMKAFLAIAGDAKGFGTKLVELAGQHRPDGTTRARAFLERFEDYTYEDVQLEEISSVLRALFDVGDQLLRPEDERRGMVDFDNDIRIGRIVLRLLRRLEEPERFEAMKEAILNGRAISTIEHEVVVLGQEQGRYREIQPTPEQEWLVSAEHLKELESHALEKVRQAAEREELIKAPGLHSILYRWRDWAGEAGEKEVRTWARKATNTDEGLVAILESFVQTVHIQTGTDVVETKESRLDPLSLEPFLDPSEFIDRARRLTESAGLSDHQQVAVREFVRAFDARERGEDPYPR